MLGTWSKWNIAGLSPRVLKHCRRNIISRNVTFAHMKLGDTCINNGSPQFFLPFGFLCFWMFGNEHSTSLTMRPSLYALALTIRTGIRNLSLEQHSNQSQGRSVNVGSGVRNLSLELLQNSKVSPVVSVWIPEKVSDMVTELCHRHLQLRIYVSNTGHYIQKTQFCPTTARRGQ